MPIQSTDLYAAAGPALAFSADDQLWTIAPGVVVQSDDGSGVVSDWFGTTLINAGLIVGVGVFSDGVNFSMTGGRVSNLAGATIYGGAAGVRLLSADGRLDNAGTIQGSGAGVVLNGADGQVSNSGLIRAEGAGVFLATAEGARLSNLGDIVADDFGVQLFGSGSARVLNAGRITGEAAIEGSGGSAALTLVNTGTLDGDVACGDGWDVVRNLGLVTGLVDLGQGFDVYDGRTAGGPGLEVRGGGGDDTLRGGGGEDSLQGGDGADLLRGGGGDDLIRSGLGFDRLTGGAGADTFAYQAPGESSAAQGVDRIIDFSAAEGDLIDLLQIDAKPKKDFDQAFVFIGEAAFTNAGQLRWTHTAEGVRVEAEVTGDNVADWAVTLEGVSSVGAADFVL